VSETVRRDFVAGLLVFVPILSTIVGVFWVIERLDKLVLPKLFAFLGMEASSQPPFLGVIVTLLVVLLAGALTRSFIGRAALRLWEVMVDRIPVARSLYSVLKQFMQALFGSTSADSFKRVVLVEYPRRGLWCYAFVTGMSEGTIPGMEGLVKIFIPSTPNPTTGYYLLVPPEDLRESRYSVDDAFRVIISAGIASPSADELAAREVFESRAEDREKSDQDARV
jgi:uncharacterized membrane protein